MYMALKGKEWISADGGEQAEDRLPLRQIQKSPLTRGFLYLASTQGSNTRVLQSSLVSIILNGWEK